MFYASLFSNEIVQAVEASSALIGGGLNGD